MRVALLGSGKTGSKVAGLHPDTTSFTTSNPVSVSALKDVDVVISFLPGPVFLEHIDLLIASKLPVVTGSTGFEWPGNIYSQLQEQKLQWIRSHNFSLGMNVVRAMIRSMSKLGELFDQGEFTIHDIHHIHKKDAPSGTALSWRDWLGVDAKITAQRKGDVVGYHHLMFDSDDEKITLIHEAKDRSIFARGALWAAQLLHEKRLSECGLLDFNEVVKEQLNLNY